MKLNSAQIEQTLSQFEAQAIPSDHPVIAQLQPLFGDHTYFVDSTGLNIVEPVDSDEAEGRLGVVVNLADWTDVTATSLKPHEPQTTELTITLGPLGEA
jgi:hypothetical protein